MFFCHTKKRKRIQTIIISLKEINMKRKSFITIIDVFTFIDSISVYIYIYKTKRIVILIHFEHRPTMNVFWAEVWFWMNDISLSWIHCTFFVSLKLFLKKPMQCDKGYIRHISAENKVALFEGKWKYDWINMKSNDLKILKHFELYMFYAFSIFWIKCSLIARWKTSYQLLLYLSKYIV